MLPSRSEIGTRILPDAWLTWWRQSTGESDRAILLRFLPEIPNPEIEHVLIDCLDVSAFRSVAAWALGYFYCYRAAAYLRQILANSDLTDWDRAQAAIALGRLRDESSVVAIRAFLGEYFVGDAKVRAVSALGFIGTPAAEGVLTALLSTAGDEQAVVAALICCGSRSAVSRAVTQARLRHNAKWLCECIQKVVWFRGWHCGKYYTHVSTAEIVEYLVSEEPKMAPNDKHFITFVVAQIDGNEIRHMFRQWASRMGTPADTVLQEGGDVKLSSVCYDELMQRGDTFAIPYFLALRTDEPDDVFVHVASQNLSHFSSEAVATALRRRFDGIHDNSQAVRLVWLLARFGNRQDGSLVQPFLDDADDLVANVACESLLRLTDPMAVPENWGEM